MFDERRDLCDNEEEEAMEVDKITKNKRKRKYSNYLMFTEWLCELPHDLEENWFVKFCPYGKRCLVVAEKVCFLKIHRQYCANFDFSVQNNEL